MLSKKHLEDVCLCRSGSLTCRFLSMESWDKFVCVKLRPIEKKKIDARVADIIQEAKKNGIDPAAANRPLGDNCQGYPLLKTIEQGYDKD
jgi:ribosomal protein S10